MRKFLKPFYAMTSLILGTSYPTSNRYFMQVWKIECLLCEYAKSDVHMIKKMTLKMMDQFTKYCHEYCEIVAIGIILDPQMKFKAIQFHYSKIDHSTYGEKINDLRRKMYKLFE